jgi:hypothetical protein
MFYEVVVLCGAVTALLSAAVLMLLLTRERVLLLKQMCEQRTRSHTCRLTRQPQVLNLQNEVLQPFLFACCRAKTCLVLLLLPSLLLQQVAPTTSLSSA